MFLLQYFLVSFTIYHCNAEFSDRVRDFSSQLMYHATEEANRHNVVSPLSIWSLLTGVSLGASGHSKQQLTRALALPKNNTDMVKIYKTYMDEVTTGAEDIVLKSDNYMFVDTQLDINPEFQQSVMDHFGASIIKLQFAAHKKAAVIANKCIQMSSHLSNTLNFEDFMDSKMILTNVITFKSSWRSPFDPKLTKVQPFYDEERNVIGKVNMMELQDNFQFSIVDDISAQVLELPYGKGERYSFLVVLPVPKVKLAKVHNALKTFSVKQILDKLQLDTADYGEATVVVSLPRFKISTKSSLNEPLRRMNITDIFDSEKASFRLISKTDKLFVSKIVQTAEIEVTETGTIASAATSSFFADRSLPTNIKVNRPFLYFVVEKSTATVIFSGAYSTPSLY